MTRRCFKEGCVFKRGRRKKVWVGRWSEYVADESGGVRRVLKSEVLGPVAELSRGDAKERLRERLRRDGNGRKGRPADVTFQVFVETWWKPAVFPTPMCRRLWANCLRRLRLTPYVPFAAV